MKKKGFKIVCGIVSFLGFMIALGSVGSIETEVIAIGRGMIQIAIGLVLFGGAGYLGGFMQ